MKNQRNKESDGYSSSYEDYICPPKVNLEIIPSPARCLQNNKLNQLKRRQTSIAGSFNFLDQAPKPKPHVKRLRKSFEHRRVDSLENIQDIDIEEEKDQGVPRSKPILKSRFRKTRSSFDEKILQLGGGGNSTAMYYDNHMMMIFNEWSNADKDVKNPFRLLKS